MKNEYFKDTRLLESLDYIDSDLIGEVAEKLRVEGASEKVKTVTVTEKKNPFKIIRQVAAIAACALLMGALIPAVSFLIANVSNPASTGGAGDGVDVADTEPESFEVIEDTKSEEIEPVVDEHGTPGLLYMINEDGASASFIGFGDCKEENVYIASVYEGLPVTKMIFLERVEQDKRLEQERLTNPDYREETLHGEDFDNPYIKNLTISDTVEYVNGEIINMCSGIVSLHVGAAVNDINGISFNSDRGQNFSTITVSPENQYYTNKGNCLIRVQDKVLLVGFADSVIPDDGSVEIIGAAAFFNRPGLTSVVVPEGVWWINTLAFGNNEELVSVSLPTSIRLLSGGPFSHTKSLTELKYAGTLNQWNSISGINGGTPWIRHTALTQVTCSDGFVELTVDEYKSSVKYYGISPR